MIELTRFDGSRFVLNADLIEIVASTPDTVITLTSDKKIIIAEDVQTVIKKVIEYKRQIFQGEGLKQWT